MYPVNQVILGGESIFNNLDDIDTQIQKMEMYRLFYSWHGMLRLEE